MEVKRLFEGITYALIRGQQEQKVGEIIYDSRIKTVDGLFIAIKGFASDGHKFIKSAIENGARTVVVQDDVEVENPHVTIIKVDNTREVMAQLASNFYDSPSTKLDLVGVTGTNGKTSTTFILAQILELYGQKVGVIGTIENRIGDKILQTERTTPESLDLQNLLNKMQVELVNTTMMEVSSHALDLNRVDMCHFKIGIFTNLTQDHLDFHKTMENYAHAKAKLFKMCDTSIINIDSDYAQTMLDACKNTPITYGIDNVSDYHATDIKITATQTEYTLQYDGKAYNVVVPIPGKFTVYNTLGALVAAHKLGLSLEDIIVALKTVRGVPGRIQGFNSKKGYSVIVDYAHTPDGLENVLQAINQFAKGEIITVFGCGGDRDNTKRPLMGEMAAKYSTKVIITSDNPRSEEPNSILDQVEVGVKKHSTPYTKEVDRKTAIHNALDMAKEGDVILVAGKGHETYQILKDGIIHFDDSEIVCDYLAEEA
ncbi:MAG: UDP-N-acetylmuramoyl-L-alanyl-D-glutamate--2,6-diaminopimelate ligase [Epulopiscium sp. Nele67-Bin004]|nr:MAG: UDP-N-acetylmuramoyl-L-alanyl-D-glutamate--2,6-diaminopimelate ligase [Epulopiscium sp. Nele67-Bin004]